MVGVRRVSVSEVLGDAEQRYLGGGFRGVQQRLHRIAVQGAAGGGATVRAALSVTYPEGWSAKSGQASRLPHLSTVDALLAAVQLAEVMLLDVLHLPPAARPWVWLRRVVIRAGTSAVNDLEDIQIRGELADVRQHENPLLSSSALFTMRFTVGALRVELELVALQAQACSLTRTHHDVEEVLGGRADRYFGEGFKSDQIVIGDGLLIDEFTIRVPVSKTSHQEFVDIGSSYASIPTFVNCVLGQAQISQLLLYSLDDMDRSMSENLWMRQVEMVSQGPQCHPESDFDSTVRVARTRLLPLGERPWRVTDFVGRFGPISSRYNLAHALPASKGTGNP